MGLGVSQRAGSWVLGLGSAGGRIFASELLEKQKIFVMEQGKIAKFFHFCLKTFDLVYRVASAKDAADLESAAGGAPRILVWIDPDDSLTLTSTIVSDLVAFINHRDAEPDARLRTCVVVNAEPVIDAQLRRDLKLEPVAVKATETLAKVVASDRHDEIKLFADVVERAAMEDASLLARAGLGGPEQAALCEASAEEAAALRKALEAGVAKRTA